MTNMTLKELMEYERELCSLQQEYEGKLTKIYGEADSSNEKRRLTIVLNLIIEERQKVNRQKYKPVYVEVRCYKWNYQFVYTENGVEKTSVDENKRMNYIDDLNRRWLDRKGDGRQRTTKIEDYRSGKISL